MATHFACSFAVDKRWQRGWGGGLVAVLWHNLPMIQSFKIVHFADMHLDAGFAWAGAHSDAARRRRQGLRETLLRVVDLAKEVRADAIFCGGDLYEHERATPDTAAFLKNAFAQPAPLRVFVAPGNHDCYGPDSVYALNEWSANVHVFRTTALQPVELAPWLTLWGGAHVAPRGTANFLANFRADGGGMHLALFHGSENAWFSKQEEGKTQHAPFDAAEIPRAGLRHAFLGHYHRPQDAEHHTYPGNPDPLAFGEQAERGAVVATIKSDGSIDRQRRVVASTEVHDLQLDVTGCYTQQAIRDRLKNRIDGLRGIARLTVRGDLQADVDLRDDDLRDELANRFDAAQVRYADLRPGYDIDAIEQEATVRGQFVRDVLASDLPPDEQRRVLTAGLRALDGRDDLDVL